MPAVDSDILYTRLFGHGEHNLYQFDDAELTEIDRRMKEKSREKAYFTFPKVTKAAGLASLKIVIDTCNQGRTDRKAGLEGVRPDGDKACTFNCIA